VLAALAAGEIEVEAVLARSTIRDEKRIIPPPSSGFTETPPSEARGAAFASVTPRRLRRHRDLLH
jgi:hypothetical protein